MAKKPCITEEETIAVFDAAAEDHSSHTAKNEHTRKAVEDISPCKPETAIDRLAALCTTWGGRLEVISAQEYAAVDRKGRFSTAPFTNADLGIFWKAKRIVYTKEWPPSASAIIHEMGHVFACRRSPNTLRSNEYRFLGWEITLAPLVGVSRKEWCDANRDYQVSIPPFHPHSAETIELGELEPAEVEMLLEERVRYARKVGLLLHDRPVAIR